jgi:hypothetical protein
MMPNLATPPLDDFAIRHLLSAVHQALDLPAPLHTWGKLPYLKLLGRRAFIAQVSIGGIFCRGDSDELDFVSEGDHILHQLAELPPSTYRHHHHAGLCP